jgi:hypothetical protein
MSYTESSEMNEDRDPASGRFDRFQNKTVFVVTDVTDGKVWVFSDHAKARAHKQSLAGGHKTWLHGCAMNAAVGGNFDAR